MKICYLADSESIHTVRWCEHFISKGHEVALISFKKTCNINNINFFYVDAGKVSVEGGNWKVLLKYKEIKKIITNIQPDILHALYATSYGVVGALTNQHPYIITALGSDVLISPNNSIIYRILSKFAFKRADWITVMADHMKLAIKKIGDFEQKTQVVSFGIDTNLFNANNRELSDTSFVVTSTRNFEPVYNIPHLLHAVAQAKKQIPNLQLNLIGSGSKRASIENLVDELSLRDCTIFHGRIPQQNIVEILNQTHIFVSVSLSDGNNISLNEAMACGALPIATAIDANKQWITDKKNGFLVDIDDVDGLAKTLISCYQNYNSLSEKSFSINQQIIDKKANWHKNLKIVEDKYIDLIHEK